MKKDIFIDCNVAKNFANPMDPDYKELIKWLQNSTNPLGNAYLVISKKLMEEYVGSMGLCKSDTNICLIVGLLQAQGRLVFFTSKQIKEFRRVHYKKKICRNLTCTQKDREFHIPIILMSDRHFALAIDDNFIYDLKHFPGFTVKAAKRPAHINYT